MVAEILPPMVSVSFCQLKHTLKQVVRPYILIIQMANFPINLHRGLFVWFSREDENGLIVCIC